MMSNYEDGTQAAYSAEMGVRLVIPEPVCCMSPAANCMLKCLSKGETFKTVWSPAGKILFQASVDNSTHLSTTVNEYGQQCMYWGGFAKEWFTGIYDYETSAHDRFATTPLSLVFSFDLCSPKWTTTSLTMMTTLSFFLGMVVFPVTLLATLKVVNRCQRFQHTRILQHLRTRLSRMLGLYTVDSAIQSYAILKTNESWEDNRDERAEEIQIMYAVRKSGQEYRERTWQYDEESTSGLSFQTASQKRGVVRVEEPGPSGTSGIAPPPKKGGKSKNKRCDREKPEKADYTDTLLDI